MGGGGLGLDWFGQAAARMERMVCQPRLQPVREQPACRRVPFS
jgi:hypothetical protein